jgi:heterodisulfide reductase subunit B
MVRPNRSFTLACARKKFESMAPYKPDLILTNCPGCLLVLDREQWGVNELTGSDFQVPVLNYAQLAGLLLGWDPYDAIGIQGHSVPLEPLLGRIGIPCTSRPSSLRNAGPPVALAGVAQGRAK